MRVTDLVKNRGSTAKQEIGANPILPAALIYFPIQIVRHLDASRPSEGAELCRPAGYVTLAPALYLHAPTHGWCGGVGCHRTVGLTDPHTSTLSPTPAAPRTPPAAADFTTRPCDLKSPSPITLLPPSPPSLYPGAASTKMAAAPPHAAP